MQMPGKRCRTMQKHPSENISQQDSHLTTVCLNLQRSRNILTKDDLQNRKINPTPKGLIDQLAGEDSVSEQIRGPGPGSGRPPRVGRLRGWPASSEILGLVY